MKITPASSQSKALLTGAREHAAPWPSVVACYLFLERVAFVQWVATGHAGSDGWATLGLPGLQLKRGDQVQATSQLCGDRIPSIWWENVLTVRAPAAPKLVTP